MAALFDDVARTHAVTAKQVRESLGRRRIAFDALDIGSFGILYILTVSVVASRIRGSPMSDNGLLAVLAVVVVSALVSVIGGGLGDVWSGLWEMVRIGQGPSRRGCAKRGRNGASRLAPRPHASVVSRLAADSADGRRCGRYTRHDAERT